VTCLGHLITYDGADSNANTDPTHEPDQDVALSGASYRERLLRFVRLRENTA